MHAAFSFSVRCFCNGCKNDSLERQFSSPFLSEHCWSFLITSCDMTIHPSSLYQLLSHVDSRQKGAVFQPCTCQLQTGCKETISGYLESHNAFKEHTTVVEPYVKSNHAQGKLHVQGVSLKSCSATGCREAASIPSPPSGVQSIWQRGQHLCII